LILRDERGNLLAEDDDGFLGTHSRIVVEVPAPSCRYLVDACALHGGRGAFVLRLTRGRPRELSELERRDLEVKDAQACMAAVAAEHGEDSIEYGAVLCRAAPVLHFAGRYAEAVPLYEQALHIFEEKLGAADLSCANCLNNLAMALD